MSEGQGFLPVLFIPYPHAQEHLLAHSIHSINTCWISDYSVESPMSSKLYGIHTQ